MAAHRKSKIKLNGFEMNLDADVTSVGRIKHTKPIMRSSFRISVVPDDLLKVKLFSELFQVLNFTEDGLQVLVKNSGQFQEGQVIDPIEVFSSDTSLSLRGEVIYVSHIDIDNVTLGIRLFFPDQTSRDAYRKHYLEKRRNLLK